MEGVSPTGAACRGLRTYTLTVLERRAAKPVWRPGAVLCGLLVMRACALCLRWRVHAHCSSFVCDASSSAHSASASNGLVFAGTLTALLAWHREGHRLRAHSVERWPVVGPWLDRHLPRKKPLPSRRAGVAAQQRAKVCAFAPRASHPCCQRRELVRFFL